MIKKNKASTSYINHPLNNSPSKVAITFGKGPRFEEKKILSPDKFYQLPDSREKRATTFGYGEKTSFVLNNLSEPAKYHLRTEFDEIAQGYRFGLRPAENGEVARENREVGREQLAREKSAKHQGKLRRTTSTLYDGKQPPREDRSRQNYSRSPNAFDKRDKEQPRKSKEQTRKNKEQPRRSKEQPRRSKEQLSKSKDQPRKAGREAIRQSDNYFLREGKAAREGRSGEKTNGERSRGKSPLQSSDQNKQRKSAYRLKYEYSNSYLLDDKRSSYIQFLKQKKSHSPIRSPVKHSQSTFGFEERWKQEKSLRNVGPGSYNRFSEFGEDQAY